MTPPKTKPPQSARRWIWLLLLPVFALGLLYPLAQKFMARVDAMQEQEEWQHSLAGNYLSARFAERQQEYDEAADLLATIVTHYPEGQALAERSFVLQVMAGKMNSALALARKQPAGKEVLAKQLLLAMEAMKKGDYLGADALLKPLLSKEEPSATKMNKLLLPMMRSWILLGQGRFPDARLLLAKVEPSAELVATVLYQRALMEDIGGNPKEAARLYDQLLRVAPQSSLNMLLSATSFFTRQQQEERAQEIMDLARQRLPEVQLKAPSAPPVASANEGLAEFLLETGNMLYQRRVDEAAILYLRLALYLRPELSQAQFLLSLLKQQSGAYAQAIEALSTIPSTDPFYAEAQRNIARNYIRAKQPEKAQDFLEARLRIAPEDVVSRTLLADLLLQQKDYAQANQHYTTLLESTAERHPERINWLYARGIGWERLKKWAKAESDFSAALKIEPENPEVLNYLAYSWVEQGINLEKALLMLTTALQNAPNEASIIDSYGWALFRLGRAEEALAYLERANEMMPSDPTVNDHLGDVYWALGRQREARFQWERALTFNPEPADEAAIRAKLKHGLRPGKN